MYTVVPSRAGEEIVGKSSRSGNSLMTLAMLGSHNLNPYHSLRHELGVVYWAQACAVSYDLDYGHNHALVVASLFHDHNHSGGVYPDRTNIDKALKFVDSPVFKKALAAEYTHLDMIEAIKSCIECTWFDGSSFPVDPIYNIQKCIRDADLMTIYSTEGLHLTCGLFEETAKKQIGYIPSYERKNFLNKTKEFLSEAKMYTEFGAWIRETQLKRRLDELEDTVMGYPLITKQ